MTEASPFVLRYEDDPDHPGWKLLADSTDPTRFNSLLGTASSALKVDGEIARVRMMPRASAFEPARPRPWRRAARLHRRRAVRRRRGFGLLTAGGAVTLDLSTQFIGAAGSASRSRRGSNCCAKPAGCCSCAGWSCRTTSDDRQLLRHAAQDDRRRRRVAAMSQRSLAAYDALGRRRANCAPIPNRPPPPTRLDALPRAARGAPPSAAACCGGCWAQARRRRAASICGAASGAASRC